MNIVATDNQTEVKIQSATIRPVKDATTPDPRVVQLASLEPIDPIPANLIADLAEDIGKHKGDNRWEGKDSWLVEFPPQWIRFEDIDFLTEAQIRGGQRMESRNVEEFQELIGLNLFALPYGVVVERPLTGPEAYVKGKNGRYLASDLWKRAAACKALGIPAYPCRVVPCPVGKSPMAHAIWLAADLNTGGPDPMSPEAKRAAAVRMYRAKYESADGIADRLKISRAAVYNAVNAAWTEELMVRNGAAPDKMLKIDQTAKLYLFEVLSRGTTSADGDMATRRKIEHERLVACVNMVNIGMSSVGVFRNTLRGWENDHSKITDALELKAAPPKTPKGAKSGTKIGDGGSGQAAGSSDAGSSDNGQPLSDAPQLPAEAAGEAHFDPDPSLKVVLHVRKLLHNEDVDVTEIAADMTESKYTVKDVERVMRAFGLARDEMLKAEAEVAKQAAEADIKAEEAEVA